MQIRKHIPNTITLFNLLSGSVAIILLIEGNLHVAAALIGLAAVFDFFDGFIARMLKVKSEIGKELDSLADVISFGLAPSMFLFWMIRENLKIAEFAGLVTYVQYAALLIAAFSALRLAKFNLDTRQTDSFLGLPTPANAMFIISLSLISGRNAIQDAGILSEIADSLLFQLALIPVSCYMLVSEIPLMALKFSNDFSFSANPLKYILAAFSIVAFILFQWAGIPVIVVFYVLISLLPGREKK